MPEGIDPAKLERFVRRQAVARVTAAAVHLVNRIKENISIPSRTVTYKQTHGGKTKKVLGARGSNRSKPGEFPHKDYGTLRASITCDVQEQGDKVVARIGSPLKYSLYLELGTRKMAARPFLRRTLKEEAESIRQIIEHGEVSSIK